MRIKDPMSEGEEPFNLVPLTDMVFNLLIFFMCATTFVQIEKDTAIQLPSGQGMPAMSAQPVELTINIREDGATEINGKVVTGKELQPFVADFAKKTPGAPVIIRADERTIMKYFAGVARVCKQAGVKEAKLVYKDDSPDAAKP